MDHRVRVYFGAQNTDPPSATKSLLAAPKSSKLFFISPPPSPPCDWESRDEDPPNREVHAEDLAVALSRLRAREAADGAHASVGNEDQNQSIAPNGSANTTVEEVMVAGRSRSATLVYHPDHHGSCPSLPAISVVDMGEEEADDGGSPMEEVKRAMPKTEMPPPLSGDEMEM